MSFFPPSQTITFEAALRDLAQASARGRLAAANALGDMDDEPARTQAIAALIHGLGDDDAAVRAECGASLGSLKAVTAVPELIRRLDDGNAVVRQSAAIALGTIGNPSAFAALAEAVKNAPADLRFQAATSLAEIDPAMAYEPLVAALTDSDPQVVSAAALSLGGCGDGRATGHLARLLDHPDAGVRFDAAYALVDLGDARGRENLAKALVDAERSWDAIGALQRLGTRADADALVVLLGLRSAATEVQVRAAGAILALPHDPGVDASAHKVLLDGLRSRKGHVRALAAEELTKVGGAWARPALEALRNSRRARGIESAVDEALAATGPK